MIRRSDSAFGSVFGEETFFQIALFYTFRLGHPKFDSMEFSWNSSRLEAGGEAHVPIFNEQSHTFQR